ncbi:MAG TPA: hypothetical protein VFV34_26055 [Blastocatellia bacterium]|nr:hypothetical protein [Blastocatellia bacterium]
MSDRRLLFNRADVHQEADGVCRVQVTFGFGDQTIEASALETEPGTPLRAAVLATLEAVERAVRGRFTCSLADLDHVNALGKNLVAVLVNVDFDGKQFQLFGSCQITGDEVDAAVKSALNATNRFVELSLQT